MSLMALRRRSRPGRAPPGQRGNVSHTRRDRTRDPQRHARGIWSSSARRHSGPCLAAPGSPVLDLLKLLSDCTEGIAPALLRGCDARGRKQSSKSEAGLQDLHARPPHSTLKRLAHGSRYHSALRPQRAARRAEAGRHEEAPPWLISGRPISRRISRDRSLNAELHP